MNLIGESVMREVEGLKVGIIRERGSSNGGTESVVGEVEVEEGT